MLACCANNYVKYEPDKTAIEENTLIELDRTIAEQAERIAALEAQLAEATKPLAWRKLNEDVPADMWALLIEPGGYIFLFHNDTGRSLKVSSRYTGWIPLSELTGHHEVTK